MCTFFFFHRVLVIFFSENACYVATSAVHFISRAVIYTAPTLCLYILIIFVYMYRRSARVFNQSIHLSSLISVSNRLDITNSIYVYIQIICVCTHTYKYICTYIYIYICVYTCSNASTLN